MKIGWKTGQPNSGKGHGSKDQLVRIEELEKLLAEQGDDVDVDTIVSMYMPGRRAKKLGAALLRMDKMRIVLLI